MTDRELMQQARWRRWNSIAQLSTRNSATQEPVAHLWQHSETGRTRIVMPDQIITADANWFVVGPLYLTPPRREWVGLTDEEKLHLEIMGGKSDVMLAEAIEAKLKEKNNAP